METMERLRFNEELFDLLAKYGYKGMIGIVVDSTQTPSVTQLVQPGEPLAYYQLFYSAICKMVEYVSGIQTAEEVTTVLPPKSSGDSGMPY